MATKIGDGLTLIVRRYLDIASRTVKYSISYEGSLSDPSGSIDQKIVRPHNSKLIYNKNDTLGDCFTAAEADLDGKK